MRYFLIVMAARPLGQNLDSRLLKTSRDVGFDEDTRSIVSVLSDQYRDDIALANCLTCLTLPDILHVRCI